MKNTYNDEEKQMNKYEKITAGQSKAQNSNKM